MKRLEGHIRADAPPPDRRDLIVRGTPYTTAKLMATAGRMASQWTFRDAPCHGVSVPVIARDALAQLLRTATYRTRHSYGAMTVAQAQDRRFILLPTFADPYHYTLMLEPYTEQRANQLRDLLAQQTASNPQWLGRSSR